LLLPKTEEQGSRDYDTQDCHDPPFAPMSGAGLPSFPLKQCLFIYFNFKGRYLLGPYRRNQLLRTVLDRRNNRENESIADSGEGLDKSGILVVIRERSAYVGNTLH
jgi:hypothetical protein